MIFFFSTAGCIKLATDYIQTSAAQANNAVGFKIRGE